ncbi:MAG: Asp-tRNA(Asn)/Glu-tRNA(Gln) amidotransferase subunit GatC [Bryobacteraceae bacterium]
MKLTESQVRGIAELANLHLSAEQIARMARELDEILTHVDKLNELDTSAVEPMAQVLYEAGATASLRDDVEGTPLDNAAALGNAPLAGLGFFKVPKVIER